MADLRCKQASRSFCCCSKQIELMQIKIEPHNVQMEMQTKEKEVSFFALKEAR